jgi:hypothetical protein
MRYSVVFSLLFLLACGGVLAGEPNEPAPREGWRVAEVGKGGNVIAGWLKYEKGKRQGGPRPDRPIEVESPYAILLLNRKDFADEGYYLFDNAAQKYFATTDFARFLTELKRLPDSAKVTEIGTCTVNCHSDLSESCLTELQEVLEEKRFVENPPLRICYCESSGIRWPDIP